MKFLSLFLIPTLSEAALDICGIVGGGLGYSNAIIKENLESYVTAATLDELKDALTHKEKYIYIPAGVIIELPHTDGVVLKVPEGTTIFGDRGIDGSRGALLRTPPLETTEDLAFPLIQLHSNTRISGLSIEGSSGETSALGRLIAIQTVVNASNIEVDNNEIFNWPWSGVNIKQSYDNRVHHNYIHHNIKSGWGYGVVVQNGNNHANVYCNVFDANRHAIAGSGEAGDSYDAHDNLVLNGGERGAYHQYDMHKGKISTTGGKFVHVQNNVFDFGRYGTSNRMSVGIIAIPSDGPITCQGNVFTQGYKVGSQVAVGGAEGSVPTEAEIKANNAFNIPVSYTMTNNECYLSFNSSSYKVDCGAVASVVTRYPGFLEVVSKFVSSVKRTFL